MIGNPSSLTSAFNKRGPASKTGCPPSSTLPLMARGGIKVPKSTGYAGGVLRRAFVFGHGEEISRFYSGQYSSEPRGRAPRALKPESRQLVRARTGFTSEGVIMLTPAILILSMSVSNKLKP